MQIYLQKYKRRKTLSLFVMVLLVIAASASAAFGVIYKHFGAEPIHRMLGIRLAMVLSDELYEPSDKSGEGKAEAPKMNNFMQNNAKNEDFSVTTRQNTTICDSVLVRMSDKSVVSMPLEEYVTGCVFGEMPLSFEPQAIMAQCVASRTFAVRCALGSSKHKDADVCTSPACCQNFISPEEKNISKENSKKLTDAVNATKGIIATFKGEPIVAVYHASSGSNTLDSEQVWGGRVEYLRSVDSPEGEEALEVSVKGHRVGMSQHGANLLAKEGKSYAEILKYYYSGISLGFLG